MITPDLFFAEVEQRLFSLKFPGLITDEETDQLFTAFHATYTASEEPFAVVLDVGAVLGMRASQRQVIAAHDKKIADFDRKWCVGVALVTASTIQRGLATAVFWLSPPVYPYEFFPDMPSGVSWARVRLLERRSSRT